MTSGTSWIRTTREKIFGEELEFYSDCSPEDCKRVLSARTTRPLGSTLTRLATGRAPEVGRHLAPRQNSVVGVRRLLPREVNGPTWQSVAPSLRRSIRSSVEWNHRSRRRWCLGACEGRNIGVVSIDPVFHASRCRYRLCSFGHRWRVLSRFWMHTCSGFLPFYGT